MQNSILDFGSALALALASGKGVLALLWSLAILGLREVFALVSGKGKKMEFFVKFLLV